MLSKTGVKRFDEPKTICIVDGYSSGSELAKSLKERGATLFHLKSSPAISAPFLKTYDPKLYIRDLGVFPGEWSEELRAELASLDLDYVIAGTETGVLLAEFISSRLELMTNEFSSIDSRRDKFKMIESIKEAGLLAAHHTLCATREDVDAEVRKLNRFPVVVKPVMSAGSDAVVIAQNRQSAFLAAEAILGRRNKLGENNSHCVIESFLEGPEYIVDLIIQDDSIVVSHICRSQKRVSPAGHPCYDSIELVDFADPQAQLCLDYTLGCLKPLGLRFGAVHAELKLTSAGPALIEMGARLAGAGLPRIFEKSTSNPVIASFSDLLLSPTAFRARSQALSQLMRPSCILFLNAPSRGTLTSRPKLEEFGLLESDVILDWHLAPGDFVQPTSDLFSSPGVMVLTSEDPEILARDRSLIRSHEHQIFEDHVSN